MMQDIRTFNFVARISVTCCRRD